MKKQIQRGQTILDFVLQHVGSIDPRTVWAVVQANPDVFTGDVARDLTPGAWIEIPDLLPATNTDLVSYYASEGIEPATLN